MGIKKGANVVDRGELLERAHAPNGNGTATPVAPTTVKVRKLNLVEMCVRVVGLTPLIMHAWGWKARNILEGRTVNDKREDDGPKPRAKKEPRDPDGYRKGCYHMLEGQPETEGAKYGVPCMTFMKALQGVAVDLEDLSAAKVKRSIRLKPDGWDSEGEPCYLLKRHSQPVARRDIVKVGKFPNKQPDVRYRPEFKQWGVDVTLIYDADVIAPASVVNLLNRAGFSNGILEYRPERGGLYGTFQVMLDE